MRVEPGYHLYRPGVRAAAAGGGGGGGGRSNYDHYSHQPKHSFGSCTATELGQRQGQSQRAPRENDVARNRVLGSGGSLSLKPVTETHRAIEVATESETETDTHREKLKLKHPWMRQEVPVISPSTTAATAATATEGADDAGDAHIGAHQRDQASFSGRDSHRHNSTGTSHGIDTHASGKVSSNSSSSVLGPANGTGPTANAPWWKWGRKQQQQQQQQQQQHFGCSNLENEPTVGAVAI